MALTDRGAHVQTLAREYKFSGKCPSGNKPLQHGPGCLFTDRSNLRESTIFHFTTYSGTVPDLDMANSAHCRNDPTKRCLQKNLIDQVQQLPLCGREVTSFWACIRETRPPPAMHADSASV